MSLEWHNEMSQNAARINTTRQTKVGMIVGPHTASQKAQPAYQILNLAMSTNLTYPFAKDVLDLILKLALQFYWRRRWLTPTIL